MAKITFYLLDISYKIKEGKPVIYMFGKTTDGKQVCIIDDSFKPYFYVTPKKGEDLKEKLLKVYAEKNGEKFEVTGVESVKKKYLENDVDALKVYVNVPRGVPQIRDTIKEWDSIKRCNEYGINFVRKYMIDKGITPMTLIEAEGEEAGERMKVPSIQASEVKQAGEDTLKDPKILAIDIETYNAGGKVFDTEKNPILMVGLHGENFNKVITWKTFKTDKKYIEFVKSELDLLNKLKEVIAEFKPDIITGYYSDGFDLPYINDRAKKYKITLDLGLDYSELKIKGRNQVQASITGIVHVDVFKFISRTLGRSGKLSSLNIDTVSESLLGEKKVEVDMDNLAKNWDDDDNDKIEEFCKYNLHDAKLAYMLCVKMLPNMIELVKIVGIPLFDVQRLGFSQLVEWFIIRQALNFNELCMERPHYNEVGERRKMRFIGAFVYEPKAGLYKDIAVFDFRSLYPTIIAAHNISPGTLNCDCCVEKEVAPTDEGKYWFCTKKKGFIPTIIEDLITRRMRIKEMISKDKKDPMLVAREQSLKLLANSFYGYLGFFNARWYSIESARAVTAWGRYHIQKVIDKAEEEGFKVVYGDTDSVFLTLDGKKPEEASKFAEKINRKLPGVMELEFEGFYPSGLFVSAKAGEGGAKKKYALLNDKDELEIKGFETVRRNWSFVAKEMQKDVLKIVLKENDPEKAMKFVKKVISDLRDHKTPIEKVVINTQLTKEIDEYAAVGPHVAAAQLMKNKGIDVAPGTIIKFVVGKGTGRIKDKVKLAEDSKQEDYDPEYYINHQVIPSVERIFNALGIDSKELTEETNQSKLGSFI